MGLRIEHVIKLKYQRKTLRDLNGLKNEPAIQSGDDGQRIL